jgi:hypothetical protein
MSAYLASSSILKKQFREVIGTDAYYKEGHRNVKFMHATDVGPYPS